MADKKWWYPQTQNFMGRRVKVVYGSKGGGYPGNCMVFDKEKVDPVDELLGKENNEAVQALFNAEWCKFAAVSERDSAMEDPEAYGYETEEEVKAMTDEEIVGDGLNASETTYDDAGGFLIVSDEPMTAEEVCKGEDNLQLSIVYWCEVTTIEKDGRRLYVAYGVHGV